MKYKYFCKKKQLGKIKNQLNHLFEEADNLEDLLISICTLLQKEVSYYNWVGFYFKNGTKNELKLKAFAGLPTDHEIIPFGKGICGQVAVSNQNFVVPDVQAQDNYISCNIHVKAEIVVPLFYENDNIGQIDIDSNTLNPFSAKDEDLLTYINEEVAKKIKEFGAYPIF